MKRSRLVSRVAIFTSLTVLVGIGATSPAYADSGSDLPIVLSLSDLSSFADSAGNAITVSSDTTTDTKRVVTGVEHDGITPVRISIYSTSTSAPTSQDVIDQVTNGVTPDDTTAPSTTVGAIAPSVAVATTPTTMTVAWVAPTGDNHFELDVNGTLADQGTTPNFTLTNLASGVSYSLSLVSTSSTSTSTTSAPSAPPIAGCASPALVATTDMSRWDTSNTGTTDPAFLTSAGLFMGTNAAGSDSVVTGKYGATFALADAGSPVLNWNGEGTAPSLTLAVDFNNSGAADGVLSASPTDATDFALSADAAQSVKDSAPTDSTGGYSGTLASWQSSFPNARVISVGYQIGPTIAGAGTLASIVADCTTFSFGLPSADSSGLTDSRTLSLSAATLDSPASGEGAITTSATADMATSQINTAEFTNRTFIPYATIAASPQVADRAAAQACILLYSLTNPGMVTPQTKEYTFIGDNRTYAQPASSDPDVKPYRTMMDIKVDWTNQTMTPTRDTGFTRLLVISTGQEVTHRKASLDGMTFSNSVINSDYAAVTFNEATHDPFCPAYGAIGAISNKLRVEFYRSGLTIVTGYRATMPDYEGWARWNDQTTWTSLYQLGSTSVACLVIGGIDEGLPPKWNSPLCMGNLHFSAGMLPDVGSSVAIDTLLGAYGNKTSRQVNVERNGLFNPAKVPITQESAASPNFTNGIINPHAWIGGKEVPITLDSNNTYINWQSPDQTSPPFFEINWSGLVIGDNTNATLRNFLNGGVFTFQVQGYTTTNTITMDTTAKLGTTNFPASNDGTVAGGDILPSPSPSPAASPYLEMAYNGNDTTMVTLTSSGPQSTVIDPGWSTPCYDNPYSCAVEYNGKLYFPADNNYPNGKTLAVWNGSTIQPITDPAENLDVSSLTVWNNKLYFYGSTGSEAGLYSYDGTSVTKVTEVTNIVASDKLYNRGLTLFDGKLYYLGADSTNGYQIWAYDGSTTTQVSSMPTASIGNIFNAPLEPIVAGTTLYFRGYTSVDSSGTPQSWTIYSYAGYGAPSPSLTVTTGWVYDYETVANGQLYFTNTDSPGRINLYDFNGQVLSRVLDASGNPVQPYGSDMKALNGSLYFDNVVGDSNAAVLWSVSGDNATKLVTAPTESNDMLAPIGAVGNTIYITGDGPEGYELWSWDGATLGLVQDINPGPDGSYPTPIGTVGDHFYFSANVPGDQLIYETSGNTLTTGPDDYPTTLGNVS